MEAQKSIFSKSHLLFVVLAGFFITNALVAEFIGVKIFSFEDTLGMSRLNWTFFGEVRSLELTVGVLLWPVVFVMTDVMNEYFGKKGVQILSYLTVVLILYGFLMIFLGIQVVPADWWVGVKSEQGIPDMQVAFKGIFGQGMWNIGGSVTAFLVGQLVDVWVFHLLKKATNGKYIWLRATGSTLISQFIDTFVVLYIAFVLGPDKWGMSLFLSIGTMNYIYKFLMAVSLTPIIYLMHYLIDKYLGKKEASRLKTMAMN